MKAWVLYLLAVYLLGRAVANLIESEKDNAYRDGYAVGVHYTDILIADLLDGKPEQV